MPQITFQPMMESRPIRDIAYEVLRHAIITGEIPAGERIVETEYASRLHISRTPLREALRRLERDGLVNAERTSGRFVTADAEKIEQLRGALSSGFIGEMFKQLQALGLTNEEIIAAVQNWGYSNK